MKSGDDAVKIAVTRPKPTVSLEFTSLQMLEKFKSQMGQSLRNNTVVQGNTLHIRRSSGSGSCGAYISSNGEVAINCGNVQESQKLMDLLSLKKGDARSVGTNTIYFEKNKLPPDGEKIIKTVIAPTYEEKMNRVSENAGKFIASAFNNSKDKEEFIRTLQDDAGSKHISSEIKNDIGKIYDAFMEQRAKMNPFELLLDTAKSFFFWHRAVRLFCKEC